MKISFLSSWYDVWIGFYWDKNKKWLYFLPLPCIGIILKFPIKFLLCFDEDHYRKGEILSYGSGKVKVIKRYKKHSNFIYKYKVKLLQ